MLVTKKLKIFGGIVINRILIVDDEIEFGKAVQRFLRLEGFDADFAVNGQQAYYKIKNAVIEKRQFELLITDLMMPHMDGFDLINKVKANYPLISIIAISGYINQKEVKEALRPDMDGFLEKPFKPDSLRTMIENLCIYRKSL